MHSLLTTLSLVLAASWGRAIFHFFRRLGVLGLFLLGVLDSSFLFLPFGNDLLLIAFVSSERDLLMGVIYVLTSALGSVVGVLIIDLIMRRAGEEGLNRWVKPQVMKKAQGKIEENAGRAVFVATLLPPPFPFTPIIMVASALQFSRKRLLVAVFLGRLLRYSLEALLAIYFGRRLIRYVNSPVVEYFVYVLIAVAAVGSTLSIIKWVKTNAARPQRSAGLAE